MSPQQTIAHYRIIAKIGEGGMGAVYRATDTRLNRDVAIKVLPPAFAEDPVRMARFEREAQLLAALNHPNIAAIYGIEQGALVMELVDGEDLKGPVPVDTALIYARQIVDGLEAAHEKGIVHRDLKPANIKVTPAGQVKLLDFGLAKATEETSTVASHSPTLSPTVSLGMTQAGVILGTAAYMSPEQARGKAVDRRADIWAFGVVLYEMLTGSLLFAGDTLTDTIASVVKSDPDWTALPKETPPHIRWLLERCLRKDPLKRLQSIGDVRLWMDDPPQASATPALASSGRRWLPWSITALMLLVAALTVSGIWLKPKAVGMGSARVLFTMPEGNEPGSFSNAPQFVPSPDGRYVAFVARETSSAKEHLWIRPLNSLSAHRMDKTEGAHFPFWSPDGQFIAFFADDKLKRIAISGGSPQTLCSTNMGALGGEGGTWGKNGIIVFGSGPGKTLMQVDAKGGEVKTATILEKDEQYHGWPQFLPDGKHLLYFSRGADVATSGLYVQELGSTRRFLVTRSAYRGAWSPPGYLLFVRESTLLAQPLNSNSFQLEGDPVPIAEEVNAREGTARTSFALSENGVLVYRGGAENRERQPTWYDRGGKRLESIGKPGESRTVSLSPDGKSAALGGPSGLWMLDLKTGVLSLASSKPPAILPRWSPDSGRLAVNQPGVGLVELTVASGKTRTLSPASLIAEDWSRDGKSLLCEDRDGHRLYELPVEGEGKARTILETPHRVRMLRFSPDGRWVAYASDQGGSFQIWIASYPSFTEKRQVSSGGGTMPFWTNGREILFMAPDGTMMTADVKTEPGLQTGTPVPLFKPPLIRSSAGNIVGIAVTSDGKRFLVTELTQQERESQIVMVLNWMAELKQQ